MTNIFKKTEENALVWDIADAFFQGAMTTYEEIIAYFPKATVEDVTAGKDLCQLWEKDFNEWCELNQPQP